MDLIDLQQTINGIYAGDKFEIIKKELERYQIYSSFKRTVILLNKYIKNAHKGSETYMGHLGFYLLTSINGKIKRINTIEDKILVEDLCGEISIALIKEFIRKSKLDAHVVLSQIFNALDDACNIYRYDVNQVWTFLKFNEFKMDEMAKNNSVDVIISQQCPCLIWKKDNEDGKFGINDFIDVFVDYELIKGGKRMMLKIFSNPKKPIGLILNQDLADEIIYIIHLASKRKLLTRKNSRSVYQVFDYHALDFKEKILKNCDPRERINSIKNSKARHRQLQEKMSRWVPRLIST